MQEFVFLTYSQVMPMLLVWGHVWRSAALDRCEALLEDLGCTPIYKRAPTFTCASPGSFQGPPTWAVHMWTHPCFWLCSGQPVESTPGVSNLGQNSAGPLLCLIF